MSKDTAATRQEQFARLMCAEIIGCEWEWLFKDERDKLNMGRRKDTPPDWNMPTQTDFLNAVVAVGDAFAKERGGGMMSEDLEWPTKRSKRYNFCDANPALIDALISGEMVAVAAMNIEPLMHACRDVAETYESVWNRVYPTTSPQDGAGEEAKP